MGVVAEPIENFRLFGGAMQSVVNPVTIASAIAHPAPTAQVTTVSGVFIPTGAFTGATGGTATATAKPIGKAFTAVAGKALHMTCDGLLWYPSYTS
jgi:hypothetical protein